MSVKIRLRRMGSKKRPFYRIVVADSRSPRDGRFIELVGTYNPLTEPDTVTLKEDVILDWLKKGAQPSDTVKNILSKQGIMKQLHDYKVENHQDKKPKSKKKTAKKPAAKKTAAKKATKKPVAKKTTTDKK